MSPTPMSRTDAALFHAEQKGPEQPEDEPASGI
jgi:hypothetical protein